MCERTHGYRKQAAAAAAASMPRGVGEPMMRWSSPLTAEQVQRLIRAERDPRRALEVFRSASAEPSYRHDPSTLSLLLSRLPPPILLPILPSLPLPLPEHTFPSLLRYLSRRSSSPLAALRLFRRMDPEFRCPPTSPSHVTMLDILVEANHLKEAHQFYKEMRKAGHHTSLPARNVLLKAFLKSENTLGAALKVFNEMPQRDSYTYGTLISGLCKLGRLEKALEVFRGMPEAPDVVAYTAVVHGLCSHGRLDDALEVFDEMGERGVKPNVVTYGTLVDGLCKGRRAKEALGMLGRMARSGHPPSVAMYSSVVSRLCEEGMLKEVVEVVDKMKLHECKPDAELYRKVVVVLVDAGRCHEARNFLDEMVLGGVAPNCLTRGLYMDMHNAVIRGLCVTGRDPAQAFRVYLRARTCSVTVEPESFRSLIAGLCNNGDVHKAARILDEMVQEGCLPDGSAWEAVISGFCERRKAQDAAESTLTRIHGECCLSLHPVKAEFFHSSDGKEVATKMGTAGVCIDSSISQVLLKKKSPELSTCYLF